jgi:chromosome segregation ATPase
MQSESKDSQNTDRELWREREGDYYADHISELSQEEMKDLSTDLRAVFSGSTKASVSGGEHSKWNTLSIQELRTVADDALRSLAEAREEIAGRKDQISDLHELLESAESERDQLRQRIEKAAELLKPCPNEDCPICKGPKRTAALAILIPLDAK